MSAPTEDPRDAAAVGVPWVTVRTKMPQAWRDELRVAARERATSMSDLVRAAVRQVMIERPR